MSARIATYRADSSYKVYFQMVLRDQSPVIVFDSVDLAYRYFPDILEAAQFEGEEDLELKPIAMDKDESLVSKHISGMIAFAQTFEDEEDLT